MELLIFIAIIVSIVNAVKKKNKEAEQAAKRRAALMQAEQSEEAIRSSKADRARAADAAKARSREDMAEQAARAEQRAEHYRQQRREAAPAAAPERSTRWRCRCGKDNEANASFCTACGKARFGGSMNAPTFEGRGVSLEGRAVSAEGMSAADAYMPGVKRQEVKAPSTTVPGGAKAARHVVKPLTESHHSHVESSISGVSAACDVQDDPVPVEEDAYRIEEAAAPAYSFSFDRNAAVQAILYSEILGKPKALRR